MINNEEVVKVKVPATSANCGPGFDCLGISCTMYNTFTFQLLPSGLQLEVEGEGAGRMHASPNNLAFLAFFKTWEKLTDKKTGLKIHMHNDIPLSRGLGSSSTAIVAGVMAANTLCGNKLNKDELLGLATELEGHPDNVAPALYGGFTVSFMQNGKAHTIPIMPKKRFKLVVLIPDMPLATSKSRAVLPKQVNREDAIFNVSRAALLVSSLILGDFRYLTYGLEDKLHQPYRAPLIPGLVDAFDAGKSAGAYNVVISGAGSALMAYVPLDAKAQAIGMAMKNALSSKGLTSNFHVLNIDTVGAKIL